MNLADLPAQAAVQPDKGQIEPLCGRVAAEEFFQPGGIGRPSAPSQAASANTRNSVCSSGFSRSVPPKGGTKNKGTIICGERPPGRAGKLTFPFFGPPEGGTTNALAMERPLFADSAGCTRKPCGCGRRPCRPSGPAGRGPGRRYRKWPHARPNRLSRPRRQHGDAAAERRSTRPASRSRPTLPTPTHRPRRPRNRRRRGGRAWCWSSL